MSWTISIPILPAFFALFTFIYAANSDRDDMLLYVMAEFVVAAIVYFAVYGLCAALGL